MRILGPILGTLVALIAFGLTYWVGRRDGHHKARTEHLDEIGLTKGAARRYGEAVTLMERLEAKRDLTGLTAGDTLSTQTRDQVLAWLADHRKEFPPA